MKTAVFLISGAVGLFFLDRLLLWAEQRGWIYYRKSKPSRGAIGYHMLEMSSVFNPSHQVVQEIQHREEKQESEAGAPPAALDDLDDLGDGEEEE